MTILLTYATAHVLLAGDEEAKEDEYVVNGPYTRPYDYFHSAAAPINYAFFLLTVLFYLQVRRPSAHNARTELYQALDTFQEVLDHDLNAHERGDLDARLQPSPYVHGE